MPHSAAPTASPPPPGSTAAARQCGTRGCSSWLIPEGVPVADRSQAPPLLRRGTGVQPVVALFEIADDPLRCSTGLWSSYLNLASTRSTASRSPGCREASARTGLHRRRRWRGRPRVGNRPAGQSGSRPCLRGRRQWLGGRRTAPPCSSSSARRPRRVRPPWPASRSGCRRNRRSPPAGPRRRPPGAARPGSAGPGGPAARRPATVKWVGTSTGAWAGSRLLTASIPNRSVPASQSCHSVVSSAASHGWISMFGLLAVSVRLLDRKRCATWTSGPSGADEWSDRRRRRAAVRRSSGPGRRG